MHNYSTAVEKKPATPHSLQCMFLGNVKPEWQAAVTTGLQSALGQSC